MQVSNMLLLTISHLLASSTAMRFNYSTFLIPHPEKVSKGGEDAFFASSSLLVVADGVGGWNNQGIDPSLYSKFLCSAAQVYFSEDTFHYTRHPEELIIKSQRKNPHPGSSTMSVVTIEGNTLRTCHVGDCRLLVLRRYNEYRLIYESVDQLHGFNFPYQLSLEYYGGDNPKEAICGSLTVREGDLVILASDGIADNIFSYEIVAFAQKAFRNNSLSGLAKKLAKVAVERSKKTEGTSPFGVKAHQWGIDYEGGKVDDTTVVVAQITTKLSSTDSQIRQL